MSSARTLALSAVRVTFVRCAPALFSKLLTAKLPVTAFELDEPDATPTPIAAPIWVMPESASFLSVPTLRNAPVLRRVCVMSALTSFFRLDTATTTPTAFELWLPVTTAVLIPPDTCVFELTARLAISVFCVPVIGVPFASALT